MRFSRCILPCVAQSITRAMLLMCLVLVSCTTNPRVMPTTEHESLYPENLNAHSAKEYKVYSSYSLNFTEAHNIASALRPAGWRIPTPKELRGWLRSTCPAEEDLHDCYPPSFGLYWTVAPSHTSSNYAWYLHHPTHRVLEYGNLYLPAWLVLVLDDSM